MKHQLYFLSLALFLIAVCIGCTDQKVQLTIQNPIDVDRNNEVVRVDVHDFGLSAEALILIDEASGQEILCQSIDANDDQIVDELLFQTSLKANQKRSYQIDHKPTSLAKTDVKTFARFVPERTDDFTWENDQVAFRTYGPMAQKMVEEGTPGGTLSSGIDCWLKKVDYSIIDKWYAGNTEQAGYYHIDHGEGLDNYHVGPSRGCGGTGVYADDHFYISKITVLIP